MATNPMQRKARNSFLLGMLIMLLISAVIVALLVMQLINMKKAEEKEKNASSQVLVLSEDVKAGGQIVLEKKIDSESTDMVTVLDTVVPNAAISSTALSSQSTFIQKLKSDADGVTRVYAKVPMSKGTILSEDMIYTDADEKIQDNTRKEEYNMIILPTQLTTGDYVDIRLMFPTGENYIVVSKKKVEIPIIGGMDSEDTIWVKLTEDEILTMSNAIYEAFMMPGAKLYATLYTDPGIQKAATPTYPIKSSILNIVNGDPNVVQEARTALWQRYNATDSSGNRTQVQQRNEVINPAIEEIGEQGASNQQSKMEESITNSKNERREWLETLGGTVDTTTTTTTTTTTD